MGRWGWCLPISLGTCFTELPGYIDAVTPMGPPIIGWNDAPIAGGGGDSIRCVSSIFLVFVEWSVHITHLTSSQLTTSFHPNWVRCYYWSQPRRTGLSQWSDPVRRGCDQGRSQEFHLGGINFNFANFAKAHTGTISNLSCVKEKKNNQ